jgi:nitrous oxide reductase accessory protein NosL
LVISLHDERNTKGENAMTTTAPYLVIGTSPFNGMDTVDECDSLEEARVFANEHGGRVVPASEYRPKGLLEDWFNNEPEDFGVLPGIDFPATLHRAW